MSRYAPKQIPPRKSSSAKTATRVGPANPISKARSSLGSQALRARLESQHLEKLALDPGQAHSELKRLPEMQRFVVAMQVAAEMQRRFGVSFADQFLAAVVAGTGQSLTIYWQAGLGPTTERLLELGYHLVGMERIGNVRVWVHPEGKRLRQDLSAPTSVDAPREERDDREDQGDDSAERNPLLEAFDKLHDSQEELAELCSRDPLPEWSDTESAYSRLRSSHFELLYQAHARLALVDDREANDRLDQDLRAEAQTFIDLKSECESVFGRSLGEETITDEGAIIDEGTTIDDLETIESDMGTTETHLWHERHE